MTSKLTPWRRSKAPTFADGDDLFTGLQRSMNRLMTEFRRGFDVAPFDWDIDERLDLRVPRVDVAETDRALEVSAELPGLSEKDVEISLSDRMLTIKGERREETEEKKKDYHVQERSYGRVERTVYLPEGLDVDKAKATFKNGVLKIELPKTEQARASTRKIQVQAG
jgi:HSP20 family protein